MVGLYAHNGFETGLFLWPIGVAKKVPDIGGWCIKNVGSSFWVGFHLAPSSIFLSWDIYFLNFLNFYLVSCFHRFFKS